MTNKYVAELLMKFALLNSDLTNNKPSPGISKYI